MRLGLTMSKWLQLCHIYDLGKWKNGRKVESGKEKDYRCSVTNVYTCISAFKEEKSLFTYVVKFLREREILDVLFLGILVVLILCSMYFVDLLV
jgi:hypothetical protein